MKIRPVYIIGMILLVVIIVGLAWAEQLTLSSYYPIPYGTYNQLTVLDNTVLAKDASGNVGIGTTSPTQKLDVFGNIHATGDICTDAGGGVCLSLGTGQLVFSGQRIINNQVPPDTWQDIDLSAYVGTRRVLVMLKIRVPADPIRNYNLAVRPNGDPDSYQINFNRGSGTADFGIIHPDVNSANLLLIETDASGVIEWMRYGASEAVSVYLVCFIT